MKNHMIRKSLVTAGLIAAFAAAPLAQVAAQDSMAHSQSSNQTVPGKANDAWITTKVKSEFATTKGVDATDISVTTKEGAVMLSGTVASSAEKAKAVKLAHSVKGVKSVSTAGLTISPRSN